MLYSGLRCCLGGSAGPRQLTSYWALFHLNKSIPRVNNLCLMKCCPLWSDVEQQSQTITSPAPIAFSPYLCLDTSGPRGGAETDYQRESM